MSCFTLTPFQRADLAAAALANGCILSWDTGLGKSLALFLWPILKCGVPSMQCGCPVLIVAPADLHAQLHQEAARFNINLLRIDPFGIRLPPSFYLASYTSLHTLTHLPPDAFPCIALDEATRIKNPDSRITRSLNHFNPRYRLAVTATPIKNRLPDLWPILKWVSGAEPIQVSRPADQPDSMPAIRIPSYREFRSLYLAEERSGFRISHSIRSDNEHRLALELAPWLITRKKSDCGVPIVARHVSIVRVPMGRQQAAAYADMQRAQFKVPGSRFKMLTALRTIAAGIVPTRSPQRGSRILFTPKLRLTLQLIDSFLTLGETALLFSPLRAQLDALSDRLRQAQVPHAVLDGRTPPAHRAAIVAAFKRSAPVPVTFTRTSPDITTPSCTPAPSLPRLPILLCGECMTDGHSFPATRNIVLMSPFLPWDKFKQSLDRIHRLNSERDIRVHVLITENTVEERHYARMLEKRKTCAMQGSTDISAFECRYPIPESDLNEYQAETAVWPILLRSLGRLGASWPA